MDRASSAVAASVSVSSVSADPTEEEQVTITVSGATEANRTLYVLLMKSGYACSGAAESNSTAAELVERKPGSIDRNTLPADNCYRHYACTP